MPLSILELAPEKRLLVFAPHADDEVLGAGGLMARAAAAGWEVHVRFAVVSGYRSLYREDASETPARSEEACAAARILGCSSQEALFVGEENHLRLDGVPQADLVDFAERGLRQIRPSVVAVPCAGHYHQDHRAVADALAAALRPAPAGARPLVPLVLAYGHAHGGWGGERYLFRPCAFVDISTVMETKMAALACYRSQMCDAPHPRSPAMVRAQCAAWGAYAGVHYAEAFECLRLLLG